MRALILLFFLGFAAASIYDALDDAAEIVYQDFMLAMEEDPSLKESLGFSDFADESEEEAKTELGKMLRESLRKLLQKIKDGIEKGKGIREEYLEKIKELKEHLKELKVSIGGEAKELLEKIREGVKKFFRDLLDKLGKQKEERSVEEDALETALRAWNLKDQFKKLKKALLSKIDKEKVKAKIEELFQKGSEMADALLKLVTDAGEGWRQKIHDTIDKYLGKKEEKRSLKDAWEKIKNYFKDFKIDLKDKFQKLGNWLKEKTDKGLKLTKDKMENIKRIAQEFRDHVKDTSVQVREEFLEFLRPYKDDIGKLWDQVKDAVKDMKNN